MRKNSIYILICLFLLITSCKKNNDPYGSWTFKGKTYNAVFCNYGNPIYADANADVAGVWGLPELACTFPSQSLINWYYGKAVIVSKNEANYWDSVVISLRLDTSSTSVYTSTGGNGSNQHIYVAYNSNGQVNIMGTGIELANNTNPSDSGVLDLNITTNQ